MGMFRFNRKGLVAAALLAAMLVLSACSGVGGSSSKYPSQPVEFVVPFAAGGGSDNMARMIHGIMSEGKFVSQPVNVANKGGGAGGVGMAYVAAKKGDQHTIMTINDSVITVPLQKDYKGPTYKDLTILAIMARDDFLIVVPKNSPHKTIEDLIAFAKANPGKVKLATAAAAGEDHVFGGIVEKAAGISFNYVHANGGADAMKMVVGGHVDVAVPNPSETLSQLEGGLVRALAVGSATRLGILKDVPTLKEKGVNVDFQMFRGIAAPAGIPDNVIKYWQDVLKKVVDSEKWKKDYVQRLGLTPAFAVGKDALAIAEAADKLYRQSLKDLGVIQ